MGYSIDMLCWFPLPLVNRTRLRFMRNGDLGIVGFTGVEHTTQNTQKVLQRILANG
jgi:hypothetical protein